MESMIWDRIWRPRGRQRSGTRRRDPLSIGVAILVNIGYAGAISGLGATIVGSLALAAVGLGASLLSTAIFTPKIGQRTPSERQAVVRQSIGPRVRFYGRVKVGGTLFFFESKGGNLYVGVTLNEGEIAGIVEYWLNDQIVTLDASDVVIDEPYNTGTVRVAAIHHYNGTSTQPAYPELLAAFPGTYTTDHRLLGVATMLGIFTEVGAESISIIYPQGNPSMRVVMDASLVTGVREGTRVTSSNPADAIYDYLTAVDDAGFQYGAGYLPGQVDLESFQSFAELCDERVPLKAGGTIPRYEISGGYALNEEQRDVLPRMLRAADADLYMTTEGRIAIRGGRWVPPVLTLDSDLGHIITGDFRRGQQALAAFNELTITYVEPSLDYQEAEAERWLDTTNIALRGKVLSAALNVEMVTSHAQARRLGKIYSRKRNPAWIGTIVTNFYGFNVLGEETVRIKFDPLGIDDTFAIDEVRILDNLAGVEISLSSLSASTYEWDADLEEGTGPNTPPDTSEPVSLDPPVDFHVSAAERIVSGSVVGTYLVATWTPSSRPALGNEAEYQLDPGGPWQPMGISTGTNLAESGIVSDGSTYNLHVRTTSPSGGVGAWSPVFTIVATADSTTPAAVTSVVGVGGMGQVDIDWVNSVSNNSIGAKVYRNTINNSGTATLIATVYGSPSMASGYLDTLGAGTYYYWIGSINGSEDQGTLVATGAKIVT